MHFNINAIRDNGDMEKCELCLQESLIGIGGF